VCRVLLTGSHGFLGKELSKYLRKMHFDVIETTRNGENDTISCDLTIRQDVEFLINSVNPDIIVHAAAYVPKDEKGYFNKKKNSLNLLMLSHLIEENLSNVKIVYISSMTVYGDNKKGVSNENDFCFPASEYARNKLEGERLLLSSFNNFAIVRIPGLFGKERREGLVMNLIKSTLNNNKLSLPKKPTMWAAMEVGDAAQAIVKLIQSFALLKKQEVINIGYDEVYSINRLIKLHNEISGVYLECEITHPKFIFDLTKLKQISGLPSRGLKDAMIELRSLL
jgi:nucleoside-diphosphate-sugar epimerase